jgi:hypothetical protein
MQSEVEFSARAEPGADLVHSPVNGRPCVYWRLRVVERLTAGSQLVHEMASSQPFRLLWGARDGATAPVRILVEPDNARIEAAPTLYRQGSAGALAVARAFGFPGALSVEEIAVQPGDEIAAAGTLLDPRVDAGPFRTIEREPELIEARLTVASVTLGQALLPWAVGTVAAVLSGVGLVSWAAWHYQALHDGGSHAVRVGHSPTFLERPQFPHRRLP